MIERIIWLALACLVAVFLLLRQELIHFSQFYPVAGVALVVAFFGGVILTGVLIFSLYKSEPTQISHVVTSLAGLLPIALLVFNLQPQMKLFPPIHDISTDLNNPPEFLFVGEKRSSADNPVNYDTANIPHQQAGYPSLASLTVNVDQQRVEEAVVKVVRQLGWEVQGVESSSPWQLEATARTQLFRYKDDVAIRLSSALSIDAVRTTTVSVRSASRVGVGDLGANAKRIGEFYTELRNELGVLD